jgi:ABC-type sugar transport system, periplasmic component
MKKKVLSMILVLALGSTMLAACGQKEEAATQESTTSSESADSNEGTFTIGAVMKDNSDTFVKNIADAMIARADEVGVELIMMDAAGDVNKQIELTENLITQGVDAIILNAMDMDGSVPCITKAKEAGIPIIVCNTDVNSDEYDAFVGADDVESGEIQSGYVLENLEEGAGVAIIQGPMGQAAQVGRMQGYENAGILTTYNVLAEQTANWKREEALALAEDWITTYGDELQAIICQNDDMAMGALAAVKATGRTDIMVVGIDAIEDALVAVENGELACTVFQDAAGQGSVGLDTALALAKGETVEQDIRIPFILVTRDNVAEFK